MIQWVNTEVKLEKEKKSCMNLNVKLLPQIPECMANKSVSKSI